jgi:hypothetical protein
MGWLHSSATMARKAARPIGGVIWVGLTFGARGVSWPGPGPWLRPCCAWAWLRILSGSQRVGVNVIVDHSTLAQSLYVLQRRPKRYKFISPTRRLHETGMSISATPQHDCTKAVPAPACSSLSKASAIPSYSWRSRAANGVRKSCMYDDRLGSVRS